MCAGKGLVGWRCQTGSCVSGWTGIEGGEYLVGEPISEGKREKRSVKIKRRRRRGYDESTWLSQSPLLSSHTDETIAVGTFGPAVSLSRHTFVGGRGAWHSCARSQPAGDSADPANPECGHSARHCGTATATLRVDLNDGHIHGRRISNPISL